jgi:hypothetical protein
VILCFPTVGSKRVGFDSGYLRALLKILSVLDILDIIWGLPSIFSSVLVLTVSASISFGQTLGPMAMLRRLRARVVPDWTQIVW